MYGDPDERTALSGELRGGRPFVPALPPPVTHPIGVDLHPIHPLDVWGQEARDWLRALVWPESHDRRERLDGAIQELRQRPLPMVAGDGVDNRAALAREIPNPSTVGLFHLHVANQMSEDPKERRFAEVGELAHCRPRAHLIPTSARSMACTSILWHRT